MPARTMFDVDRIASGIGHKTISRRAVAKGAAWTLPVLATGIAAPAVAQSPETCSDNSGAVGSTDAMRPVPGSCSSHGSGRWLGGHVDGW